MPMSDKSMEMPCPFCNMEPARIARGDQHCFTVRDGFPVSEGHTLVIVRRHVGSFFELTQIEREAVFGGLESAKADLDREYAPAAYNIGINDGEAAGQTVLHLHVHLIPRYEGDVPDPRGGVRWIFPDKAAYWSDRD